MSDTDATKYITYVLFRVVTGKFTFLYPSISVLPHDFNSREFARCIRVKFLKIKIKISGQVSLYSEILLYTFLVDEPVSPHMERRNQVHENPCELLVTDFSEVNSQ